MMAEMSIFPARFFHPKTQFAQKIQHQPLVLLPEICYTNMVCLDRCAHLGVYIRRNSLGKTDLHPQRCRRQGAGGGAGRVNLKISYYNFNQCWDSSLPGSLRRRTLLRADMESAPTVGIGVPDAPQTFMASESAYPGLTRPVLCGYRFYNQDLTTGSLLIEIGGHANTLDEALRAGRYAAEGLVKAVG